MFKTLQNAFKIKDIRQKLIYTFLMLIVIRLGSQLPIPGVNRTFFCVLACGTDRRRVQSSGRVHRRLPGQHVNICVRY